MTTPDTLYLEVDEEIPSVVDKLRHLDSPEVILVVPAGASLIQSLVNVKLLRRTAEQAKKRLSFVTTDDVGRHVAGQVGIPVYVSVKDRRRVEPVRPSRPTASPEAPIDLRPEPTTVAGVPVHHYGEPEARQGALVRASARPADFQATPVPVSLVRTADDRSTVLQGAASSSPRRRGWRFLAAGFAGAALLILLGYWYPRATVTLTVATQPFTATPALVIDSSKQFLPEGTTDRLVGERLIASATATKEVPATGSKDVGAKARGTVSLENRLGQAVKLSSGTKLVTATGVVLATTTELTTPAATASIEASGAVVVSPGRIDGAVEAAQSGEAGNVAKGTTLTVQGLGSSVQDKVSAIIKTDLSGGTTQLQTVVSDDDLTAAKQAADETANQEARAKLTDLAAGQALLDDAVRLTPGDEQTSAKAGDEAQTVSATRSVSAEAITFDEAVVQRTFTALVEQAVPSAQMLVVSPDDGVTTTVSDLDWSAGTFRLEAVIQTHVAADVDQVALIRSLVGQSVTRAGQILSQRMDIDHATVTLRPGWLPRLPVRPAAFRVEYAQTVER